MLEYIRDEVKPDSVFWLGDSIPHNVDSLNFKSNVEIMKNVTSLVSSNLEGFRIYPVIGNHDTYPQDIIKFDKPRENDAINEWDPAWLEFLDESA
jgi:metallophosphoesterase superfamily enzyme